MNQQNSLTAIIHNTILEKIASNRDLLIAYSGGIDSTVLLHALMMIQKQSLSDLKLKAIYVHHGISKNADSWAKHCQQQCLHWQIPCIVEKVTLALEQGNIEEQARNARYSVMHQHLSLDTILCTAQHQDDQSETFLLALKRGSGPAGLSAMAEFSKLNGHTSLLRPLLTITRQQIEQYAQHFQLSWIEDESNQDQHYDRNFLRLSVLPILNQRWPHFNQMVVRSAKLCQEQQQLLDELLNDTLNQRLGEYKSLSITGLSHFSRAKYNALLRMWFKLHQMSMPSRKQLDTIWQTMILSKEDSNPIFLLHKHQIRRYQNRFYLLPQYQDLTAEMIFWDLKLPLVLPDNLGVLAFLTASSANCRLPLATETVSVRFYAQGMFNIVGRKGSRAIKKLWQEYGIPPWQRTRTPLIFYNDILITAVGIFVTELGRGEDINYQLSEV